MITGWHHKRVIAAASSAAEATATLLRFSREAEEPYGDYGEEEPIEKLLDAAKMAIEASDQPLDGELGQVYAAVSKFLEGWAG